MAAIEEIFAVWNSASEMAREIGVGGVTVRQWRNRSGAIPVRYWGTIRAAAARKGVELPVEAFLPDSSDVNSTDPLIENAAAGAA